MLQKDKIKYAKAKEGLTGEIPESFIGLNIRTEYRTLREGVVREFYLPLMERARLYQRAVGFFSSSALEQYSAGLKKLADNGGNVQLVASPRLSEEDAAAIKKGYELRNDIIERALLRELVKPANLFAQERLNLLANYIADNILDIRIAILENKSDLGIYHEKLGLLYDFDGNAVAFTGSANETNAAMNINYEAIDVFCSWNDYEHRVQNKINAFNRIWNNNEPGVTTMDFPRVKEEILRRYKKSVPLFDPDELEYGRGFYTAERISNEQKSVGAVLPEDVKLYDYQIKAIDEWEKNGFRGIFDMATGTGKTFTALGALVRICQVKNSHLAVIIVCPYQHLVEQWTEDLNKFGVRPIVGHSGAEFKNYKKRLENAVFDYNLGVKRFICFICTNDTYADSKVQMSIRKIRKNSLLIVDEAHNFGAESMKRQMDFDYTYRLGLSATLERHGDEAGTAVLYAFFGKKCIEYDLKRAIDEGKLTPYYYYPVPVYLTEDELLEYGRISRELQSQIKKDKNGGIKMTEYGRMLAIKRARIAAGAQNKKEALKLCIKDYRYDNHMLVYCGTAAVADKDSDEEIRQIDSISKMLGFELNMKVAQYTSRENMRRRAELKKLFAAGDELQALVAIKCLDEGVNIPAIKTAFILASTSNPKEYIQRRGRVLRLAEGKDFARIYDFVTLPRRPDAVSSHTEEDIRFDLSLIKSELRRMYEFKRLSKNPYDSDELIWQIRNAYNFTDDISCKSEMYMD